MQRSIIRLPVILARLIPFVGTVMYFFDPEQIVAEARYSFYWQVATIQWEIARMALSGALLINGLRQWIADNIITLVEFMARGIGPVAAGLLLLAILLFGLQLVGARIVRSLPRWVEPEKALMMAVLTTFFLNGPDVFINGLESIRSLAFIAQTGDAVAAASSAFDTGLISTPDDPLPAAIPDVFSMGVFTGTVDTVDLTAYYLDITNLAVVDSSDFPPDFESKWFPEGEPASIDLATDSERETALALAAEGNTRLFFSLLAMTAVIGEQILYMLLQAAAGLLYLGLPIAFALSYFVFTQSLFTAYMRQFINLVLETFWSVIIVTFAIWLMILVGGYGIQYFFFTTVVATLLLAWRILSAMKHVMSALSLADLSSITGGASAGALGGIAKSSAGLAAGALGGVGAMAGAALGQAKDVAGAAGNAGIAGGLYAAGRRSLSTAASEASPVRRQQAERRGRELQAAAGYVAGRNERAGRAIETAQELRNITRRARGQADTSAPDGLDYLRVGQMQSHYRSNPWLNIGMSSGLQQAYQELSGGRGFGNMASPEARLATSGNGRGETNGTESRSRSQQTNRQPAPETTTFAGVAQAPAREERTSEPPPELQNTERELTTTSEQTQEPATMQAEPAPIPWDDEGEQNNWPPEEDDGEADIAAAAGEDGNSAEDERPTSTATTTPETSPASQTSGVAPFNTSDEDSTEDERPTSTATTTPETSPASQASGVAPSNASDEDSAVSQQGTNPQNIRGVLPTSSTAPTPLVASNAGEVRTAPSNIDGQDSTAPTPPTPPVASNIEGRESVEGGVGAPSSNSIESENSAETRRPHVSVNQPSRTAQQRQPTPAQPTNQKPIISRSPVYEGIRNLKNPDTKGEAAAAIERAAGPRAAHELGQMVEREGPAAVEQAATHTRQWINDQLAEGRPRNEIIAGIRAGEAAQASSPLTQQEQAHIAQAMLQPTQTVNRDSVLGASLRSRAAGYGTAGTVAMLGTTASQLGADTYRDLAAVQVAADELQLNGSQVMAVARDVDQYGQQQTKAALISQGHPAKRAGSLVEKLASLPATTTIMPDLRMQPGDAAAYEALSGRTLNQRPIGRTVVDTSPTRTTMLAQIAGGLGNQENPVARESAKQAANKTVNGREAKQLENIVDRMGAAPVQAAIQQVNQTARRYARGNRPDAVADAFLKPEGGGVKSVQRELADTPLTTTDIQQLADMTLQPQVAVTRSDMATAITQTTWNDNAGESHLANRLQIEGFGSQTGPVRAAARAIAASGLEAVTVAQVVREVESGNRRGAEKILDGQSIDRKSQRRIIDAIYQLPKQMNFRRRIEWPEPQDDSDS